MCSIVAIRNHYLVSVRRVFYTVSAIIASQSAKIAEFIHVDGLQHKGAMSTKPVFKKVAEIQKSYAPLCRHTPFVLLTPARTSLLWTKSQYFAMM